MPLERAVCPKQVIDLEMDSMLNVSPLSFECQPHVLALFPPRVHLLTAPGKGKIQMSRE